MLLRQDRARRGARTRATSQQPRAGLSDLHLDQDLEHVAQPSPASPAQPSQPSPAQPSPAQHSGTVTTCYIFVAILNLLLLSLDAHDELDNLCRTFHSYLSTG